MHIHLVNTKIKSKIVLKQVKCVLAELYLTHLQLTKTEWAAFLQYFPTLQKKLVLCDGLLFLITLIIIQFYTPDQSVPCYLLSSLTDLIFSWLSQ